MTFLFIVSLIQVLLTVCLIVFLISFFKIKKSVEKLIATFINTIQGLCNNNNIIIKNLSGNIEKLKEIEKQSGEIRNEVKDFRSISNIMKSDMKIMQGSFVKSIKELESILKKIQTINIKEC